MSNFAMPKGSCVQNSKLTGGRLSSLSTLSPPILNFERTTLLQTWTLRFGI